MNITSNQKKAAILGAAVVLIGGGAFVYFDPLGLDLMGVKQEAAKPVAAAAKAQPHPAKTAKTAAATPDATKDAATPPTAASAAEKVATSKAAVAPDSVPAATVVATAAPQLAESQPPLKRADPAKSARAKPVSSPSADLRHCLDQPTNADIAKCAGE